jgi:hypothetical protein
MSLFRVAAITLLFTGPMVAPVLAQERAYFVTYDHYLEEPGNLEIAIASTTGAPRHDHAAYTAPWLELGYGVTGWWTAELYFEGVTTRGNGSAFTGWRFENRFRPLAGEHRLNPVLYVEYENISEASRIQKEIVGAGSLSFEPIAQLKGKRAHELEGKLILSSVVGPWNIAENFILEKNLSASEGVEFGYSVGVSRPLGALASGTSCHFCTENVVLGMEAYGGLGSTEDFTRGEQRHYVAPVVGWHVTGRTTLKASAAVGLTENSDRYLLRFGFAYELPIGGR